MTRRSLYATVRVAILATLVMAVGPAAGAGAATHTLSGSCQFAGPISPTPPITVLPRPGAHFSYRASGACAGKLDGVDSGAIPISVLFTNVATLFDTCELGPDFNLKGILLAGVGQQPARFRITINLARLAIVGAFALTTPGHGRALGTAMFAPSNYATALQQCATTGVGAASLAASFRTLSPLVGGNAPPPRHSHRHRRSRTGGRS